MTGKAGDAVETGSVYKVGSGSEFERGCRGSESQTGRRGWGYEAHRGAIGSGFARQGPQHSRKRSQSAKTSCDPGHDFEGDIVPGASSLSLDPATTSSISGPDQQLQT